MQVTPGDFSKNDIISKVERSELLIPRFQRAFVWSKEQTANLIDSILHNYPIGSFIIWRTTERLKSLKKLGDVVIPNPPDSGFVYYILDGQQRITSLYVSLKGCKVDLGNDSFEDYGTITVDLNAKGDERIVYSNPDELDPNASLALRDLINLDLVDLFNRFNERQELISRIDTYRKSLESYRFSKIDLEDADINVATEVFTRLNTSGKALSAFEIMCAKMYDEARDFDLLTKREEQIEEWKTSGFDTVPNITVLQAVCACIKKTIAGKDILALEKNRFIDEWPKVTTALNSAIDYLRTAYGVAVSKLLPYDVLLVPFTYYFRFHPTNPSGDESKYLQDYFWRCVVSSRFGDGMVNKVAQDIENVICPILKSEKPVYDKGIDLSFENLKLIGGFTTSSAFVKGVLCILASKHPLSFKTGVEVTIDNAWLTQGNSKNYHHFFPKKYMEKNHPSIDAALVNHIANITIVDSHLNKNEIRAKGPFEYMPAFARENSDIENTMKTHLISYGEKDEFGILSDDYDKFFTGRLKCIQTELLVRVIINPDLDIVSKDVAESAN